MKILVVEDIELNRFLMYELLTERGHEVIMSGDGQEAIMIIQSSPYTMDLIFMDIHMPVLDGISATKQIRQMKEYKQIPIIVLTSDILNVASNEDLNELFDGYLLKPIDIKNLQEIIDAID